MIEIVYRSGPPEALCCPALICDACREQIIADYTADVSLQGNAYYWSKRDNQGRMSVSPMLLAHKGHCDQALRRVLGGNFYQSQDGWDSGWDEIGTFLDHLGHNAITPFSGDEEGAYRFADIVPPPADLMLQLSRTVRQRLGLPAGAKHLRRPSNQNGETA